MKNLIKHLEWNILFLIPILVLTSCSNDQSSKEGNVSSDIEAKVELTQDELIALGEYNVITMGCHECHSPKIITPEGPVPDPERLLSGHPQDEALANYDPSLLQPGNWYLMSQGQTAFVGSWGTSYAGNITSDATGIGNWTEDNFKIALKEGWFKGIRDFRKLLPPMPWRNFREITNEDIHAIFIYLQSTKPVNNIVPEPVPPQGEPGS